MDHVQVAIIGSGPAGLLLSHLLHARGIRSVVLERRTREYVEGRIRAGILEQGTVDLIREVGLGERMAREGLVHDGIEISAKGKRHRIDLAALTGGRTVTVYGQTEMTKDLIQGRLDRGEEIVFEATDVALHEIETDKPRVMYRVGGDLKQFTCDFIAGCDGYHGVSRPTIPDGVLQTFERVYPFAWLGILAEARPPSDELIYVNHPRGFALFSMRSTTISRNYIQCVPDEDLDEWPDDRVWEELRARLGEDGALVQDGTVLEKSITPMRSFVAEPMRHGRLFLAGDAAHIVPPTGAKGLNLAASDVYYLSRAIGEYYETGREALLDSYSDTALDRIWKAQRFSWWMTSVLHRFGSDATFDEKISSAELDYALSSEVALGALAENYVGLPY